MKLLLISFLALVICSAGQYLDRSKRSSGGWNRDSGNFWSEINEQQQDLFRAYLEFLNGKGSGFRPNYPDRPQIQPTAPPGHHIPLYPDTQFDPHAPQIQPTAPPGHHYPLEPIWPVENHRPQIQPTAPPGHHVPLYPDTPFNPHRPQIQPTAPPGHPIYPNKYPQRQRPQIQPTIPPDFLRPFQPDRPQIQPTFSPRPFKQQRPQIQPPLPSGHYPLDLGLSFRIEESQIKTDFGTKSGDKSYLPEGSARTDRKGGQFTRNRR